MAMVVSSGALLQDGMPLGTPSAAGAVHDGPAGRTSLGAGTAQGAVLACYALHLTSGMVEFGLASLVAVVLNYTLRCVTQDPLWAGHHTHMIRLFWLGFLGGLAIALSTGMLGGIAILLNAVFGGYVLVRLVLGVVRAVRGRAE